MLNATILKKDESIHDLITVNFFLKKQILKVPGWNISLKFGINEFIYFFKIATFKLYANFWMFKSTWWHKYNNT